MVGGSGVTVDEGEGSGVAVEVGDATFSSESGPTLLEAISSTPPCDGVREELSSGMPAFHGRKASPPHAKMITATTKMPQVILALVI